MKMKDIMNVCSMLRKKGEYHSNIVAVQSLLQYPGEFDVVQTENAIMFVETGNNGRKNLYFAASGEEAMIDILSRGKEPDTVVSYLYREEPDNAIREIFSKAGLTLYAEYIRFLKKYSDNPYLLEIKNPRRKILQEMYDPACGEYPTEEDAVEIYEIHMRNFDAVSDDIFSIDEWKEKIRKKEVLVYREDGKIIAYYNWKLEGNTFYSNVSVDEGPANIMYNLERRVFEKYWEQGIRIFYFWVNKKNGKQLRRDNVNDEPFIVTQQLLYQDIFCFRSGRMKNVSGM